MFLFAEAASNPSVIQLGTLQALVGLAVVLVAGGAAWGSLKTSIDHIAEDVKELKADLKGTKERLTDVDKRLTGVEVSLNRSIRPARSR